jgi:xanthine dehydrogenase/oxidase
MSLYGLLKINPEPGVEDIEEAFDGNLCRCTGYRPIIESARSFVKKTDADEKTKIPSTDLLINFNACKDYDPKSMNDPIFPIQLTKFSPQSVLFTNDDSSVIWFRPSNLDELLVAKDLWPTARLIGGNSEIGVEMNLRDSRKYNAFIYVGDLNQLGSVKLTEKFLEIGVNITLTDLIESLTHLKSSSETLKHQKSLLDAFLGQLRWFASRHIRNFATLGGNIATGSPISDLNPILVACDAHLTVCSRKRGQREVRVREEFLLAYRKVNLEPDEVILKVSIPLPTSRLDTLRAYKQAKRKSDDIALVNGCYRVKLSISGENENMEGEEKKKFKIESLDISLGGVSFRTVYLKRVNENSRGLVWGDAQALKQIEESILSEVEILYSAPGLYN